ncbi:MAG: hypothetical protein J0L84_02530 [Verrucomicrobia bacterium]|nr:hypothetical protein [Verrucomicrobiota bacterium]
MERLDRQRNWLLEDPEQFGKKDSASQWLPSLEEQDYTTNPRRPQTALGRRLRADNQDSRSSTDSKSDRFENPSSFAGNATEDPLSSEAAGDSGRRYGLNPSWSSPSAAVQGSLLDLNGALPDPSRFPSDRASDFGRPGRGLASGLDSYSRERLDRYDRVLSGDEGMERSSSLGDWTERLRQRELRTEVLMPAMRNPAAAPAASALSGEDPGVAATPLARSGLGNPVGGVAAANNPYLPPLKAAEPYESPAAKMLRTPPVQPPRFRP